MARRMDTGLGTSERVALYRAQSAMLPPQRQLDDELAGVVAAITCRSCRARIPVDDIDAHECSPVNTKAGGSFLDLFLDAEPSSSPAATSLAAGAVVTRRAEVPQTASPWTSPTSLLFETTPSPGGDKASELLPAGSVFYRPPHLSSIGRSLSVPSTSGSAPPIGAIAPGLTLATASASNFPESFFPRSGDVSNPNVVSASLIQCRVRGVRVSKSRVAVYSIISSLPKKPEPPHSGLLSFVGAGANASASMESTVPPKGSLNPLTTTESTSSSSNSSSGSSSASILSNEVVVERRYREFYAFALTVYSMFPSHELWQRLPPKTYCALLTPSRRLNDGFLIRRKNGLDDFMRCAIAMMDLDSSTQGSLAQWYATRLFLNISPSVLPYPSKDRSLLAAVEELKLHIGDSTGWRAVGRLEEADAVFEKVADGFPIVKRVRLCHFPARAVFDMIVQRSDGSNSPKRAGNRGAHGGVDIEGGAAASVSAAGDKSMGVAWDPNVERREVLRREDGSTWVERTVYKGRWISGSLQTVSLKTWRVEETGAIVIVMIPADERDWVDLPNHSGGGDTACNGGQRVDCILGGWLLAPTPGEETCTVTWLMQANFGACDPQEEFTGTLGLRVAVARRVLLSWANEVSSLLAALETTYEPEYYRRVGPMLSTGAFQKLQLDQTEVTMSALEDPRVYAVACELEPRLCLLLHKSSNRNALVFKVNMSTSSKSDVDAHAPLKAEWIMFEKSGNPRQELSAVERNTTYKFLTRLMAPNVHRVSLDLLRRDCVLRYDPMHGYALFTTINGQPNTLLKRVFLSYAKAPRMGFARLEEVALVGETETEVMAVG